MIEVIYWILVIITMLVILGSVIYNLVNKLKRDEEIKEINRKMIEILDKKIELLESEDK